MSTNIFQPKFGANLFLLKLFAINLIPSSVNTVLDRLYLVPTDQHRKIPKMQRPDGSFKLSGVEEPDRLNIADQR